MRRRADLRTIEHTSKLIMEVISGSWTTIDDLCCLVLEKSKEADIEDALHSILSTDSLDSDNIKTYVDLACQQLLREKKIEKKEVDSELYGLSNLHREFRKSG